MTNGGIEGGMLDERNAARPGGAREALPGYRGRLSIGSNVYTRFKGLNQCCPTELRPWKCSRSEPLT